VMVACPAHILGTSAPLPMRLMSIPPVGRALLTLQSPSPRQVDRVFAMVHESTAALPEIRDVMLACERLPRYAESIVGLLSAVMRFGRVRPEIALTAEQLAQINHPVQMIWGRDDPFGSPAVARRAVGFLRDGELHIVPGGHAPQLQHAEQVGNLAMRFLRVHRDAR
jgi:2-hydroxy-6-oxonona-2,4-dienedioate hydrolase